MNYNVWDLQREKVTITFDQTGSERPLRDHCF